MVFWLVHEAFKGSVTNKSKPTGMKWNASTCIVWLGSLKQSFCLHVHIKLTCKKGCIMQWFISTVTTLWICSDFYN